MVGSCPAFGDVIFWNRDINSLHMPHVDLELALLSSLYSYLRPAQDCSYGIAIKQVIICSPQSSVDERKEEQQPCIALTGPQIARYWKHVDLPLLSEREISDKSKADFFTKAIATLQIGSLLLSIIVRTARDLDFSQLELITLAFAACGVFTYVARWYKTQNVDTATTVKLRAEASSEQYEKMKAQEYDRFWQAVRHVQGDTEQIYEGRIPNDYLPQHRIPELRQRKRSAGCVPASTSGSLRLDYHQRGFEESSFDCLEFSVSDSNRADLVEDCGSHISGLASNCPSSSSLCFSAQAAEESKHIPFHGNSLVRIERIYLLS